MLENYLILVGRSLLALYFLIPGVMKFIAWDMHVALMDKHAMPMIPVLLALAGVVQVGAGLCLLAGRYVVECALVLAAITLLINANLHDFWNFSGIEAAHEQQNFVKNLGIFAGLLLLGAIGTRKQV